MKGRQAYESGALRCSRTVLYLSTSIRDTRLLQVVLRSVQAVRQTSWLRLYAVLRCRRLRAVRWRRLLFPFCMV